MKSKVEQLHSRADSFVAEFEQGGRSSCFDQAIGLDREAIELCPLGHPKHFLCLTRLAGHLSNRYEQFGAMRDLQEAVTLNREVLEHCPRGHPLRCSSLNNLALCLSARYEQLGTSRDLDEAIALDREALDLRPPGHPLRSSSLNNLSVDLFARFDRVGAMVDLNEAIALDREALNLRPSGHSERPMSLNSLAADLSTRYEQFGAVQDLDEAIILGREALALLERRHPDRTLSLNNLAVDLSTRYKQLGEIEDLDEAISLDREALILYSQGHPGRSMSLNNLAVYLSTRYEKLGIKEDLDEAIILGREGLKLRPQGHPLRFNSLYSLAAAVFTHYKQLAKMEHLDEAISLSRNALSLCPPGHPNRSQVLDNLACYLRSRFTESGQSKDTEELFGVYRQLVNMSQMVSSSDLTAARAWIQVAEDLQHPTMLLAYETALRLLVQHLATLPSLPQHLSILKTLTSSLAVDAFSACLRNHAPTKAVELLEQGRGVFWGQLTRLRSPLDDVIISGPAGRMLADEFTRLASLIRSALDSPGSDQHERVCHLNLEMQRVTTSIRELPGLSYFLLPSLFTDLQCAASEGPVVIVNASQYGCDALIVLNDRDPVHIPLQITQERVKDLENELHILTKRTMRADMTKQLAFFLRRIWDQIVLPIVDILQKIHPLQSRIWWCPTAEFSALPLHAAGPYRKGQPKLPDLYISSYTPTLAALIRARKRDQLNVVAERKRFVAIGQAKATGACELLSIASELDTVGQCVRDLTVFMRVDGEESCVPRVVEELGRNEWVHLACHGLPNQTRPFESGFAFHDEHFTIQRIIGCDLKNPEFAYLSACHTTVGDEESPDEAIHLASAMQFAGFRSVIGTMWAVDDGETAKITSTFYKHMVDERGRLDHTRAAFALNQTMKSVDIPFDQRVLYIHLGA